MNKIYCVYKILNIYNKYLLLDTQTKKLKEWCVIVF